MFLIYKYDIFWAFLIISSVIPILAFLISGVLSPINKGPEKLSSMNRIRYYMFALVFDVEMVFLYPWAMSFDVLGLSIFIEALIFVLILIVGSVYAFNLIFSNILQQSQLNQLNTTTLTLCLI